MFLSSKKREIRHFHVVVVQRRQRNVQKSVMHVQSCVLLIQGLGHGGGGPQVLGVTRFGRVNRLSISIISHFNFDHVYR